MHKIFVIIVLALILSGACFSAMAQQKIVPIFDLKNKALLGGVRGGVFVDAETAAKSVQENDKISVISLKNNPEEQKTVKKYRYLEVCQAHIFGENEEPRSGSGIGFGDGLNWNPLPRAVSAIAPENETYLKFVRNILKTHRINESEAKITQAVKVDLEGDGVDEVILAGTNYRENDETGEVFGYSFVIVRKYIDKSIRTIFLAKEFYSEKKGQRVASQEVDAFEVAAVADLNGDGNMEIVLNSFKPFYDGGGTEVFQLQRERVLPVQKLGAGCGFF